jgi:hypothetical protein
MAEIKNYQYGNWSKISDDLFYQITKHLDITSVVWLAACSKELCRPVAGLHHWGGPCLLVPDPSHSHYDDNTAGDMVYDILPLDHPRLTTVMSFMYKGDWVGMNGEWITVFDENKKWFLMNVYTRQEINIPLPGMSISKKGDLRLWVIPHVEDQMPNTCCTHVLMKLVICEVPTKVGQYADYKLIALFKTVVAYLEGSSQEWRFLHYSYLNDSVEFSDAIEHGGIIYAVDESEGRTYC